SAPGGSSRPAALPSRRRLVALRTSIGGPVDTGLCPLPLHLSPGPVLPSPLSQQGAATHDSPPGYGRCVNLGTVRRLPAHDWVTGPPSLLQRLRLRSASAHGRRYERGVALAARPHGAGGRA